ncbi:NUAK SNF1-like kinase 1 [Perkinsus olseni]|uniref:NUAK SNF1-like kinase 1 n=1 Tax=Perkinsus olseni TaxID=32597 RepID=A0A7J6RDF8_PEROL|nr:NUAK SNF1-like kinase 1 [Perkinsus olseni]
MPSALKTTTTTTGQTPRLLLPPLSVRRFGLLSGFDSPCSTRCTTPSTSDSPLTRDGGTPSSKSALAALDASYTLGSSIASGAYGRVCRSVCRQTGSPVALKVIDKPAYETFSPDASMRSGHGPCEAEILEMIAGLDVEGVPKILDVFEDADATYIVSELGGLDLYEWLQRSADRDQATVLEVITRLLLILEGLHNWGIAHNDVKLENILLDESGQVHLIDFGNAVICRCLYHVALRRQVLEDEKEGANSSDGLLEEERCRDAAFAEYCEEDLQASATVLYQLFTGSPISTAERSGMVTEKKEVLRRVSKGELLSADEVRELFEQQAS